MGEETRGRGRDRVRDRVRYVLAAITDLPK